MPPSFCCSIGECSREFHTNAARKRHERRHAGARPHTCDFGGCGKAFTKSDHLANHKRTHTGEKPYKCDFDGCDKVFTESGGIVKHKRTHTGEKPYKCDFDGCGKAFSESGTLTSHKISIHSKVFRFVCETDNCGHGFYRISSFKNHIRSIHGGVTKQCIKVWEQRIKDQLIVHNLRFEHNTRFTLRGINGDKDQAREFDFIVCLDACCVVLEVDEKQHGHGNLVNDVIYSEGQGEHQSEQNDVELIAPDCDSSYNASCELARQEQLRAWLRTERNVTSPIFIIRYNPHSFKVSGIRQKLSQEARETLLISTLQNLETTTSDEIIYMFSNSVVIADRIVPEITLHAEYSSLVARSCRVPIVG